VFRRSKTIRDSLTKTRRSFFGQISNLLGSGQITEETWEDLEALLVQADVGVTTTMTLVDGLREQVAKGRVRDAQGLQELLREELLALQWLGQDDEHRQVGQALQGPGAQGSVGRG